jgi:hypothetical protein
MIAGERLAMMRLYAEGEIQDPANAEPLRQILVQE